MPQEIIGDEVVTTITTPLETFIEQRKMELEMLNQQTASNIARTNEILTELSNLIN